MKELAKASIDRAQAFREWAITTLAKWTFLGPFPECSPSDRNLLRRKAPPHTAVGIGATGRIDGTDLPVIGDPPAQPGEGRLGDGADIGPTPDTEIIVGGIKTDFIACGAATSRPPYCRRAADSSAPVCR